MSYRFIKLVAATAMIAATAKIAQAQTVAYHTSSPIAITALDVAGRNASWTATGGYAAGAGLFALNDDAASIALRFVNNGPVPATAVTFVVNTGRDNHRIVDKGVFSPGVPIAHTFPGFDGSTALAKATGAVAEVDFADGTIWRMSDDDAKALTLNE